MKTNHILKLIRFQPINLSSDKKIDNKKLMWITVAALAAVLLIIFIIVFLFNDKTIKMALNSLPAPQQIEGLETTPYRKTIKGVIVDGNMPQTKSKKYNKKILKLYHSFAEESYSKNPDVTKIEIEPSCYLNNRQFLSTKIDAKSFDSNGTVVTSSCKTYVHDIINNSEVSITNILKNDATVFVDISNAIVKCISSQKNLSIKKNTLKNAISASPVTFSEFILVDNKIYFIFNNTSITEHEICVSCDLEKLNSQLNADLFISNSSSNTSSQSNSTTTTINSKRKGKSKVIKTKLRSKSIALTFDDGPHPTLTKKLLKTLKKYGVKVTFFVLGSNAKKYPKIIKKAYKDGHEIGMHSWSHTSYTKLKTKKIRKDIKRCKRVLKKVLGSKYTPNAIRLPFGNYNKRVLKACKKEKVKVFAWSIDTLDWKYLSKKRNIKHVTKTTRKKDIILMHDIHAPTVASIKKIIINLSKKNFDFVTVNELLPKSKFGKLYFSGR